MFHFFVETYPIYLINYGVISKANDFSSCYYVADIIGAK